MPPIPAPPVSGQRLQFTLAYRSYQSSIELCVRPFNACCEIVVTDFDKDTPVSWAGFATFDDLAALQSRILDPEACFDEESWFIPVEGHRTWYGAAYEEDEDPTLVSERALSVPLPDDEDAVDGIARLLLQAVNHLIGNQLAADGIECHQPSEPMLAS